MQINSNIYILGIVHQHGCKCVSNNTKRLNNSNRAIWEQRLLINPKYLPGVGEVTLGGGGGIQERSVRDLLSEIEIVVISSGTPWNQRATRSWDMLCITNLVADERCTRL